MDTPAPTPPTGGNTLDINALIGLFGNGQQQQQASSSKALGIPDLVGMFKGQGFAQGLSTSPQQAPATGQQSYDPGSIQSYAQQRVAQEFPGDPNAWQAFNAIVNQESGWNPNAQNPTSTAYGIGQFLDSTWQGVGAQKTNDPNAQIDAMVRYVKQRYGTPSNAETFHLQNNWY